MMKEYLYGWRNSCTGGMRMDAINKINLKKKEKK